MNYLITTITQSLMAYITARGAKALFSGPHAGICGSRGKAMTRVVTVLAIKVASKAKIVIFALKAVNEIVFDKYYHIVRIVDEDVNIRENVTSDTCVAGTGWSGNFLRFLLFLECTRHFTRWLWSAHWR